MLSIFSYTEGRLVSENSKIEFPIVSSVSKNRKKSFDDHLAHLAHLVQVTYVIGEDSIFDYARLNNWGFASIFVFLQKMSQYTA